MGDIDTTDYTMLQDIKYEMPQHFIGVVTVQGYRGVNETGEDGYWILLEPGKSNKKYWASKDSFDKIYLPVQTKNKVSDTDIESMIDHFIYKKVDERTIMGIAVLKTGFRLYSTASCLGNKEDIHQGKEVCKNKIALKLKSFLGFITQWATDGVRNKKNYSEKSKYIDLTDLDDIDL